MPIGQAPPWRARAKAVSLANGATHLVIALLAPFHLLGQLVRFECRELTNFITRLI
jgi:hypothetical protein